MKAIVTIQNEDGTYSEVGMNTRASFGPYKRINFIRKRVKEYAKNRPHRIEYFAGSILNDPTSVEFVA